MAIIFEHKDRRAIPNWRTFDKTIELGELNNARIVKNNNVKANITSYLSDWKKNKSISFAGDFLSAAYVMDVYNDDVVDVCKFILTNENENSKSLTELALKILKPENSKPDKTVFNQLEDFVNQHKISSIYIKIRFLKKTIAEYPKNPINYVELARLYSIIGQKEKSIKAMEMALRLSPNNRFVLRAATRLFYNLGDYNKAHHFLLKAKSTKHDSWLLASEISIATVKNKSSRLIGAGKKLLANNNNNPFNLSELASAIGTVEAINGSDRQSKKHFNFALISPNDNSLAQSEWASNVFGFFNININEFQNDSGNFEVKTLDALFNDRWEDAIENSINWFLDMPNNKDPLIFGAKAASIGQKNHLKASSLLKAGLTSFPSDSQLLNNVAYHLALGGKPEEAESIFNSVVENTNLVNPKNINDICVIATSGLINFRLGKVEKGRNLYLKAIEEAKNSNDNYHTKIAILNYLREELRLGNSVPENLLDKVKSIKDEDIDIEIKALKHEVLNLSTAGDTYYPV